MNELERESWCCNLTHFAAHMLKIEYVYDINLETTVCTYNGRDWEDDIFKFESVISFISFIYITL